MAGKRRKQSLTAIMAARLLGQVLRRGAAAPGFRALGTDLCDRQAATCPDSCPSPLGSVPDEGLGVEHVRRAIAPQLNLRRQGASIHRCPERDKSVPRTPDPAMAFPQLMRARSGQQESAPFCKVRQASSERGDGAAGQAWLSAYLARSGPVP